VGATTAWGQVRAGAQTSVRAHIPTPDGNLIGEVSDPGIVGQQVRSFRIERGLSQGELAERANVSVDLISKLEQGTRQTARISTLTRLAAALDVDLGRLLDKRPRLASGPDTGTLIAVRDVLVSPDQLPGMDRDDGGAASDAATLAGLLDTTWDRFQAGQFGRVAALLPGLIGECRASVQAGDVAAASPLAQAYQIAARLMVYMGNYDLSAIATERALAVVARSNDELLWANLHATFCWSLLNSGRHNDAESHAVRIAEQIEPTMSKASAEHVAVWGGLLLKALAAAAAANRDAEARQYISLARAGASRLEGEHTVYGWMQFGPTQVAMQETHAHTVLGRPTAALRTARDVRRDQLLPLSWGRHLLDVARSQLDRAATSDVVTTLHRAHQVSPEWFRHQAIARAMVSELVNQQRRLSPEVRALAQAADFQ
jgi:DNA-binding Xre family transcriptional regulator